MDVFDDSISKEISDKLDNGEQSLSDTTNIKSSGKVYRIANLYVGKIKNGIEYPVLFHKDKLGPMKAFLNKPLKNPIGKQWIENQKKIRNITK